MALKVTEVLERLPQLLDDILIRRAFMRAPGSRSANGHR
jgi:hypothetical protein